MVRDVCEVLLFVGRSSQWLELAAAQRACLLRRGAVSSKQMRQMHGYAASRAMDGVCRYALGKRSEVCCRGGGEDVLGRKTDMALLLLGQASISMCRDAGQGEMGVVGGSSGGVSAVRRPRDGPSRSCSNAGEKAVQGGFVSLTIRFTLVLCQVWRREKGQKMAVLLRLLPTQDAEAGSTLTRAKPHIALAHNAYLYCLH